MAPPMQQNEDAEAFLPKSEYHDEHYDEVHLTTVPKPRRNLMHTICYVLLGAAISFLAVGAVTKAGLLSRSPTIVDTGLATVPPGGSTAENGYWCGHTPEEARARNCHFDVILYSWIPEPCFNQEIQDEYVSRNESAWYRERGGKGGQVSKEVVAAGNEQLLWIDWASHMNHCKFLWKLTTVLLLDSSMGVPGTILAPEHIEHCINVLTGDEYVPMDSVTTRLMLDYSTCYDKKGLF